MCLLYGIAVADAVQISFGVFVAHLTQDAIVQRELGVRTGTDAQIVTKMPVIEVVQALPPRLCEG